RPGRPFGHAPVRLTDERGLGCWSSFQITSTNRSATRGRARVAAEISHCCDIHVLDIPPIPRTLDRIKGGLPNEISFVELDTHIVAAARSRRVADDTRGVVLEVAGRS